VGLVSIGDILEYKLKTGSHTLYYPTNAHNVKKRRFIKTF